MVGTEKNQSDNSIDTVTVLLAEAQEGRSEAWNQIYALIYEDLHRLAKSRIRRHGDGGMSPTSLVSETWLRLAHADLTATDRSHLIALIARAMRYVIVDQVRRMVSQKRGEGFELLTLGHALGVADGIALEDVLLIDQALTGLAATSERTAKVVELRYFGGLTEPEIAQLLGITERTVSREWRKARAYLQAHFGDGTTHA